jgi:hypothetical protein
MPALPEDAEVEHYERDDGQDSCSQGRVADVTQGVPPGPNVIKLFTAVIYGFS